MSSPKFVMAMQSAITPAVAPLPPRSPAHAGHGGAVGARDPWLPCSPGARRAIRTIRTGAIMYFVSISIGGHVKNLQQNNLCVLLDIPVRNRTL